MPISPYNPHSDTVISQWMLQKMGSLISTFPQWYSSQYIFKLTTFIAIGTEVQNEWSYNFTPSYAFMA